MLRTCRPAFLLQMQRPPHADILRRLEPADIAEFVGLVEIEDQAGFDQPASAIGDLDGAPRRGERHAAYDFRRTSGRQHRAQPPAVAFREIHAGVVDQRRLVDGDVNAVVGAQRNGRLRHAHFRQLRAAVEIFFAIPFERRNPPCGRRLRDREFGQLLFDLHLVQAGLLREFVAEADAVVEHAHHYVETPTVAIALDEARAQFVVMIADEAALAPGLFPGLVEAARRLRVQRDAAQELAPVAQDEAQPRVADQRLALARHAIGQSAFAAEIQFDLQRTVGRSDFGDGGGMRGSCQPEHRQQQRGGGRGEHRATSRCRAPRRNPPAVSFAAVDPLFQRG